jgi:hypothetical protein
VAFGNASFMVNEIEIFAGPVEPCVQRIAHAVISEELEVSCAPDEAMYPPDPIFSQLKYAAFFN